MKSGQCFKTVLKPTFIWEALKLNKPDVVRQIKQTKDLIMLTLIFITLICILLHLNGQKKPQNTRQRNGARIKHFHNFTLVSA